MNVAFLFPGQSSRYLGLLAKLARLHGRNRDIINTASDILKHDMADHYREDSPVPLERNRGSSGGRLSRKPSVPAELEEALEYWRTSLTA